MPGLATTNLQSSLGNSKIFCYAACHLTTLMKSEWFKWNICFVFLFFWLYSTCKYGKVFLILFLLMLNSAKQNIITFYNNFQQTFEQPGVKAPGTANRTPFLPANNSAMLTLPFGVPSITWTDGSLSPTCYVIDNFLFSTNNLTYICILPGCTENY